MKCVRCVPETSLCLKVLEPCSAPELETKDGRRRAVNRETGGCNCLKCPRTKKPSIINPLGTVPKKFVTQCIVQNHKYGNYGQNCFITSDDICTFRAGSYSNTACCSISGGSR